MFVAGASGRDAGTVPAVTSDATLSLAHAAEAGGLSFVQPDGVVKPGDLLDLGVPAADVLSDRFVELGRFQQVVVDELAAELNQRLKQFHVPNQRQTWEIGA